MMLANNLSGSSPAWGPADPSTIYLFVLPQGTQVDAGELCCDGTGSIRGYHYEVPIGASSVPYAVACNCTVADNRTFTPLNQLNFAINHELAEAATDPFPSTSPAFKQEYQAHAIWAPATFGGEVADLCTNGIDASFIPPGSTYMVQRTWSNAAAMAGTAPCVPVPAGDPYFNSYPTLPDTVTLNGGYWG
jgi:hypothetical protein